uniref:Neuregulin 2a n=1 Tax=Cyprinodon variegatus TaxID=28743 RepID=A0A3Q2CZ96_CYPVA
IKNPIIVSEGSRLTVKCEATGNPDPSYRWFKDGSELEKKKIKTPRNKKSSKVLIKKAKPGDSGNYTCVVENPLGKDNSTGTVNVQSITTTLSPDSGHTRGCNKTQQAYCVNGGECFFVDNLNEIACRCPDGFYGRRCSNTEPQRLYMSDPLKRKMNKMYIFSSFNRKQRKKMHNHMRQNMCPEHPNRNLANGPNHPGPGPEEIPMVDYISKNVPATERVTRPATERSFPASHASSRSHNSSTRAHSSTQRYVSALTTPARLSPVDFHYSLPPQVPTFQITSPNASHAMSLPPAVHNPYPLEDDQPLLRRYQVPLHDAQCQEPYRQQRRTYLKDSRGSLPSSPYRLAEEEDYETTQEYLSSREQPKTSGSGETGSRRWRRSRLNGHVAPRGYEASRDYGSRSCLTESESEEDGENTPFLSMQNMNAEPSTIYRPVDSRTSHSSGWHSGRGNMHTRLTQPRSKPDSTPH